MKLFFKTLILNQIMHKKFNKKYPESAIGRVNSFWCRFRNNKEYFSQTINQAIRMFLQNSTHLITSFWASEPAGTGYSSSMSQ
jgi:hypothetical protein